MVIGVARKKGHRLPESYNSLCMTLSVNKDAELKEREWKSLESLSSFSDEDGNNEGKKKDEIGTLVIFLSGFRRSDLKHLQNNIPRLNIPIVVILGRYMNKRVLEGIAGIDVRTEPLGPREIDDIYSLIMFRIRGLELAKV